MSSRKGTSVIVVAKKVTKEGETRVTYYGPFLPHAGSATTSFLDTLDRELADSGRYASYDLSVDTVFVGEDESDCAVRATR